MIAYAAIVSALLPVALGRADLADCKNHPLLDPTCWTLMAPAAFNVSWTFGKLGAVNLSVQRKWSPLGVDRFYNLVKYGYFSSEHEPDNNAGMFRVVPGFVVQFGIAGNATVAQASEKAVIDNDPVILSNIRGTISYAAEQDPTTGKACNRTTQVYINYGDNSSLDADGFTPFGVISEGDMKNVSATPSKHSPSAP
jgi:peptidyl-prolyl cis-trans isomerase A (cyclophilin A)